MASISRTIRTATRMTTSGQNHFRFQIFFMTQNATERGGVNKYSHANHKLGVTFDPSCSRGPALRDRRAENASTERGGYSAGETNTRVANSPRIIRNV